MFARAESCAFVCRRNQIHIFEGFVSLAYPIKLVAQPDDKDRHDDEQHPQRPADPGTFRGGVAHSGIYERFFVKGLGGRWLLGCDDACCELRLRSGIYSRSSAGNVSGSWVRPAPHSLYRRSAQTAALSRNSEVAGGRNQYRVPPLDQIYLGTHISLAIE
jgi:hypothetical protein